MASGNASTRVFKSTVDPSGRVILLNPSSGFRPGRRVTVVDATHSSGK
jgi:hypothetical protein